MKWPRARSLLQEWLEAERMARHETVEDAARSCGLSPPAFRRRSGCGQGMHQPTAMALAGYLRVTPEMVGVLANVPAEHAVAVFRADYRTRKGWTLLWQELYREQLRRGKRLNDAAKAVGISLQTLNSLRRGTNKPFKSTLRRVARYLGVDLETVIAWHQALADEPLPLETWMGRKLHPTVRPYAPGRGAVSCADCVFLEGCREDVMCGDFAWCEDATEADFCPGEPEREMAVGYA